VGDDLRFVPDIYTAQNRLRTESSVRKPELLNGRRRGRMYRVTKIVVDGEPLVRVEVFHPKRGVCSHSGLKAGICIIDEVLTETEAYFLVSRLWNFLKQLERQTRRIPFEDDDDARTTR
jgi:hypothetical protein